jgi:hypothetical protein
MKKKQNVVFMIMIISGISLTNSSISKGSDIWLRDNEQYTFNGVANIDAIYACDSSTINFLGGQVRLLYTVHNSSANVSGGYISGLIAWDTGFANISGGQVGVLHENDNSTANISGGNISKLQVLEYSSTTFYGKNFEVSGGLILDGDKILGTGTLKGEWLNSTQWTTIIEDHESTATIRIVPEPATILIIGLGTTMMRKRLKIVN